jgi:hypothetical protein
MKTMPTAKIAFKISGGISLPNIDPKIAMGTENRSKFKPNL